jgi:hypothetical protein
VYVEQTWARPDMVEAHKCTTPDATTTDAPDRRFDLRGGQQRRRGRPGRNTLYYTGKPTTAANLADMTTDLHNAFYGKVASNPAFAGVAPVGDAFQRAVNQGFAKGSGFYRPTEPTTSRPPHPSICGGSTARIRAKYGSYLSALVLFQTITGHNP